MAARPATDFDPEAQRKLIWDLGPTLRDLFEAYGVPRLEAAEFLRDSLDRMALECRRRPMARPRRWLLETLETRCRQYRERDRQREKETPDDGPPHP